MTVAGYDDKVLSTLRENDITCHTYVNDVQRLVDDDRNEMLENQNLAKTKEEFNLTIYHDYPEVLSYS